MGTNKRDYLAIILVGCGSSYARGPDKQDCIDRVKKIAVSDWKSLFKLKGAKAVINVVDVTGHDDVWWDERGVHAEDDKDASFTIEKVEVTL